MRSEVWTDQTIESLKSFLIRKSEMTAFLIPSILTTIVICQINIFLNSSLLFTIFCLKGITSKSDMSLVYSRFAADIGYSCSIIVFKLYVLAGMISKTFILKNIIFFVIRATVILGIIRTSLLFIISLDRIIALFSSQFYNPNRRKLPLSVIFLIISSSIAFDHFIMFGYCENVIDTPIDCDSARCCYNACYAHFWISREQVMFCCIVMMTVLLSLKLVVCTYFTHNQHARILSRATQIAMIDSTTLILFNLIPILTHVWFASSDYQTYASITTLSRNLGFLMNTLIIFRILMRDKKHVVPLKISS